VHAELPGMPAWGEDPELLATFRAEVEERLASMQQGLLALEGHPSPRQVVAGLFRDAHTVKGSARMLGLDAVLRVAHTMEDLLGALRDGRFVVRRDLVDLLLAACDGIARALPGDGALPAEQLAPLVDALTRAVAGEHAVAVPALPVPPGALPVAHVPVQAGPEPEPAGPPGGARTRCGSGQRRCTTCSTPSERPTSVPAGWSRRPGRC